MKHPLPQLLDSTMLACWRQCRRKFKQEFLMGFRPPGLSIDLHAGGCFALAMEVTRRGVYDEELSLVLALEKAHAAFMVEWGEFPEPTHPSKKAKGKDHVWEAVIKYFEQYPPREDHVQPYQTSPSSIEYTFAVPLDLPGFPIHSSGDPFLYGGRFDLLGSYLGEPCGLDDKTTGRSFSQDWSRTWDLRGQFIGYKWAARQCGIDLSRIIVRGVLLQVRDKKILEAEKIYPDYLIDRWLHQLRLDLNGMVDAWQNDYFDFNLAEACTSYGLCIFHDGCLSADPDAFNDTYQVNRWNPLLKNPIKEAA